jgi:hypothetical protein
VSAEEKRFEEDAMSAQKKSMISDRSEPKKKPSFGSPKLDAKPAKVGTRRLSLNSFQWGVGRGIGS